MKLHRNFSNKRSKALFFVSFPITSVSLPGAGFVFGAFPSDLFIVSGQSNTTKNNSDGKAPKTKPAPGKETKKSALERLLEKFR